MEEEEKSEMNKQKGTLPVGKKQKLEAEVINQVWHVL